MSVKTETDAAALSSTAGATAALDRPGSMRTAAQCVAKAEALEQTAGTCPTPETRDDYLRLASEWRATANKAAWQDAATNGPANLN